jgi:nicotinamide mononucleotide transporter
VTLTPEVVKATQILAALLGAAYVVMAARRSRLCWLAGGLSSTLVCALSFLGELPMQGLLNGYYIGMAVYGYWNWNRMSDRGELPIRTLHLKWHLLAALVLVPFSWFTAELLARETQAAWPFLDSATAWFSLFATWLMARARIENWIYWIIIDGVLVYLYYMQGFMILALQFAAFTGLAVAGFIAWRRRLLAQAVIA